MCRNALAALLALFSLPLAAREIIVPNRDHEGLILAIETANADPSIDRIRLAPGGLYTLRRALPGQLGLPTIQGRLEIDGNGAEIRRYSTDDMTLIDIAQGADVTLRGLSLAEGNLGVIRNRGRLHLQSVTVTDSTGERIRGIVLNHGELNAEHSTFQWNRVEAGGRDVGTIINYGRLRLAHSRIVDNRLSRRFATLAAAGAILNHGILHLETVDMAGNEIEDELGGLAFPAVVNLDSGQVSGIFSADQVLHE